MLVAPLMTELANRRLGAAQACRGSSRAPFRKALDSESADIRSYRASTAAAAGPGMYRDGDNQWVIDPSIRLEAGATPDDAIEL